MEINYELKQSDLIEFSNQFAKTQSQYKPIVILLSVMMLTFVFADLIYLLMSGLGNFRNFDEIIISILIRTVISFGIIGLMYLFSVLMQKRITKKVESTENNGILCEHKIILDENEFIEITDVNTSRHTWGSIGEIKELEGYVLINVNFVGTHFIPKRYFNNEEHIKEFVETATYYQHSAKNRFTSSHLADFERNSGVLNKGELDI